MFDLPIIPFVGSIHNFHGQNLVEFCIIIITYLAYLCPLLWLLQIVGCRHQCRTAPAIDEHPHASTEHSDKQNVAATPPSIHAAAMHTWSMSTQLIELMFV